MRMRLYILGSCAGLALNAGFAAGVDAQSQGTPQTQPFGQTHSNWTQPYQAPGRDENGNRIVINGQQVGSGAANPARRGGTLATQNGSTLPSGSTLSGTGSTTAVSIGNSVSIANTFGSTIIINQTNNADQTVNVNGTPDDGEN